MGLSFNAAVHHIGGKQVLPVVLVFSILVRFHISAFGAVISVYLFDLIMIALIVLLGGLRLKLVDVLAPLLLFFVAFSKILVNQFDVETLLACFKIFYYFIVFRYFFNLKDTGAIEKRIFRAVYICFFINLFVATVQLLDIPFLNKVVYFLYSENSLRSLWSGYPRIIGTFYNPNWFGIYLALMGLFFTFVFYRDHKWLRYMLLMTVTVLLIFASGSRTGVFALAVGILAFVLFSKRVVPVFKIVGIFFIVMAVGLSVVNAIPEISRTMYRFTSYFESLFSSGVNVEEAADSRWSEWNRGLELFYGSPIFGAAIGTTIPHNAYITTMVYFGFLGLMVILPISLLVVYHVFKTTKEIRPLFLSFLAVYMVCFLSGDYLYCTQVFLMFVLAYGLLSKHVEERKTANGKNNRFLFAPISSDT